MKMKNPPVSDVAAPTDSHSKTLCSFCTKAVGKAFLEWDIDHYDLSEKSFTIPPTYLQRNSTLECPFCQLMKIFLEKIDGGLLQVANHVKLSMELSSLDGESPFDLGGQEYSDVYIRHIPTSTTKVYTLISQSAIKNNDTLWRGLYSIDSDTDLWSQQAKKFCQTSLHGCLKSHAHCSSVLNFGSPGIVDTETRLPLRVLDVSTGDDAYIRLHISTDGEVAQYIALSYCWGGPQDFSLMTTNLDLYTSRIQLETLPLTLQHTVEVVRQLGYRYLWIDSMCILQDSESDKVHEIEAMASIYSRAVCTIAAATHDAARKGFLVRDIDTAAGSYCIQPDPSRQNRILLFDGSTDRWDYRTSDACAYEERGWTFQEMLFARRVLYFPPAPHPVYWFCQGAAWCNGGLPTLVRRWAKFADRITRMEDPYDTWREALDLYAQRCFTDNNDILPALSNLAKLMSKDLGTYHAGLWSEGFDDQLFWRACAPHYKKYHGPSWSWCSCPNPEFLTRGVQRGEGSSRQYNRAALATRTDITTEPMYPEAPFGRIKFAYVTFEGSGWFSTVPLTAVMIEELGLGVNFDGDEYPDEGVWLLPIKYSENKDYPTSDRFRGLVLHESSDEKFRRVGLFSVGLSNWFNLNCTERKFVIA